MRFGKILAGIGLAMAMLGAVQATAQAPVAAAAAGVVGTWVNPRGTVKVQTGACGDKLCGWVVWANAEAQQDAKDSGVARLIGTELLQDYHPTGHGKWQGRVYVPDMGQTFYSKIEQQGPNALKISGCILGGWICKSQVWQRG